MTRKKLTIGDNSGLNRKGERCKVVRCLDGIEVGEVVSIRFKDEFETTPWRLYRLEEKHFPSKYDEDRRRHTGTFVRIPAATKEEFKLNPKEFQAKGGAK